MRVLTSPSEWPAGAQRLQQKQDVQMQLASQRVCCASCALAAGCSSVKPHFCA